MKLSPTRLISYDGEDLFYLFKSELLFIMNPSVLHSIDYLHIYRLCQNTYD